MDLDDPQTTELRKQILLRKPFLRKIYNQWYSQITDNLPSVYGPVLELGTGAGFLGEYIPGLITSDLIYVKGCDLTCSAMALPLADNSLRAVVMLNVLHHIPEVDLFFDESARCLKNGGKIIMIEPWLTTWSQFIYQKFHHEPFDPDAYSWNLPLSGPLSGGNDALPWIIFNRDIERFRKKHNNLKINTIINGYPISYLLSGGISFRNLVPQQFHTFLLFLEKNIPEAMLKRTAMFSVLILEKQRG